MALSKLAPPLQRSSEAVGSKEKYNNSHETLSAEDIQRQTEEESKIAGELTKNEKEELQKQQEEDCHKLKEEEKLNTAYTAFSRITRWFLSKRNFREMYHDFFKFNDFRKLKGLHPLALTGENLEKFLNLSGETTRTKQELIKTGELTGNESWFEAVIYVENRIKRLEIERRNFEARQEERKQSMNDMITELNALRPHHITSGTNCVRSEEVIQFHRSEKQFWGKWSADLVEEADYYLGEAGKALAKMKSVKGPSDCINF